MKQILRHIPNILTLCNLLCGMVAIVYAFQGSYAGVFFAVISGALFDFADGFAARLLRAYSPIGAQLDSLADMVTFGVAPSMIMFHAFGGVEFWPAWGAFALAAGSALRLAKFNIDTEQTEEFRGLPTPAMALFFVSFAPWVNFGTGIWVGLLLVGVFVALMTCRLPMFSLKFKSWGLRKNGVRYLFLLLSLVGFLVWGLFVLPVVMIATYVLYSLFSALWKR